MSEKFDPAKAINERAKAEEKRQRKLQRAGKRLAKHAVRQANKGYINEPVTARSWTRFVGAPLIDNPPEVYDQANERLKEHGLRVELHKPMNFELEVPEIMKIHVIDQSEPVQEIPVRHGEPNA